MFVLVFFFVVIWNNLGFPTLLMATYRADYVKSYFFGWCQSGIEFVLVLIKEIVSLWHAPKIESITENSVYPMYSYYFTVKDRDRVKDRSSLKKSILGQIFKYS